MPHRTYQADFGSKNKESPYNALFLIWFNLEGSQLIYDIVYTTTIEKISTMGAFLSVVFSIFSLIFLIKNKNYFYQQNDDWKNFDDQFKTMKNIEMRLLKIEQRCEIDSL